MNTWYLSFLLIKLPKIVWFTVLFSYVSLILALRWASFINYLLSFHSRGFFIYNWGRLTDLSNPTFLNLTFFVQRTLFNLATTNASSLQTRFTISRLIQPTTLRPSHQQSRTRILAFFSTVRYPRSIPLFFLNIDLYLVVSYSYNLLFLRLLALLVFIEPWTTFFGSLPLFKLLISDVIDSLFVWGGNFLIDNRFISLWWMIIFCHGLFVWILWFFFRIICFFKV